jgi:hypothetical protein
VVKVGESFSTPTKQKLDVPLEPVRRGVHLAADLEEFL